MRRSLGASEWPLSTQTCHEPALAMRGDPSLLRMARDPLKFKRARIIASIAALVLIADVAWEIYSGAAIEKTGGPTYRAIHPTWYWFDVLYHASITAVVVWLAYRGWRSD